MTAPLDPFSFVVNEGRRWMPEWYQWLDGQSKDLANALTHANDVARLNNLFKGNRLVQYKNGFNVGSFRATGAAATDLATRFYANPGSIADTDGVSVYSSENASLAYMVDTSQMGLSEWSGIVNPPAVEYTKVLGGMADTLPVNGSGIFPLVVRRDTSLTDAAGNPIVSPVDVPNNFLVVMATTTLSYTGLAANLALTAPGFVFVRFLPFATKYVLSHGPWNGIPQFFTDVDGNSRTILSEASPDANFLIAGPLTSATITDVGGVAGSGTVRANNLMVDPCRTALFAYTVDNTGSGPGIASFDVSTGAAPFSVAHTSPGDIVYGEKLVKLDGALGFKWACTGGARLFIFLKSFWYDEPV